MAVKDPFSGIPDLPVEETRSGEDDFTDPPNEKFTKGNTPRNVLKSIQKWAMFFVMLGVIAFVFWPDEKKERAPAQTAPTAVDETKQASDVSSIVSKLKEEAEAAPTKPGSTQAQNAGQGKTASQPQAPGLTPKEKEFLAKAMEDQKQRDENIRASALEASGGSFKFVSSTSDPAAGVSSPFKSKATAELQSQIDDFNRARTTSEKNQQGLSDKMIAQLGPKETPRTRSSNEEYLSQQAAASNDVKALQQQAPLGRFIVSENTPVRSVLLSGVKSDVPGKVRAMVTSDVWDSNQECVVIPKGSELVGGYNNAIITGQESILMGMSRLILLNGTWVPLGASQATDMIGQAGLPADVNNHFFKMFSSSFIIGAASLLLPKDQNTVSSISTAGGVQNGGSVLALTLNDILKTTLERNRVIAPTLTLKPGEPLIFTVAQDMNMSCYR